MGRSAAEAVKGRMPAVIYIYCPSSEDEAVRGELMSDVERFVGGRPGFNLDFELADGEDVEW